MELDLRPVQRGAGRDDDGEGIRDGGRGEAALPRRRARGERGGPPRRAHRWPERRAPQPRGHRRAAGRARRSAATWCSRARSGWERCVAFLGYIGGLFGPVQGLTNTYQTLRKATVSLETHLRDPRRGGHRGRQPGRGERARRSGARSSSARWSFAYQPGDAGAARHRPDRTPGGDGGAVGPSGSGKTTLVTLLQRLHPVSRRRDHDRRDRYPHR